MDACSNIESGWVNSGPLYINPAPPSFTVGTPSAKICNDAGSVSINITSDNSTTEYFFGYLTSTGEDASTSFTGNGQHVGFYSVYDASQQRTGYGYLPASLR